MCDVTYACMVIDDRRGGVLFIRDYCAYKCTCVLLNFMYDLMHKYWSYEAKDQHSLTVAEVSAILTLECRPGI